MHRKAFICFLLMSSILLMGTDDSEPFDREKAETKLQTIQGSEKLSLLTDLADYYKSSNPVKALEICEQALILSKDFPDQYLEGRAHLLAGVAQRNQEKFNQSIERFQAALSLFRQAGERKMEASTLTHMSKVYTSLGQFPQAIAMAQLAIPIYTELKESRDLAIAHFNLGNAHNIRGDLQKALEAFLTALKIAEQNDIKDAAPHLANSLGNVYSDLGEEMKALDYYQKAYQLIKGQGQELNEAMTLNNIACSYKNLGRYQEAESTFKETIAFARSIGLREPQAKAWHNMGNLLGLQNKWSLAITQYQKALQLQKELKNQNGEALSRKEIANAHFQLNDFSKAREELLLAIPIFQQNKSSKFLAESYRQVAEIYEKSGDFQKAYRNHRLYSDTKEEIINEEKNKKVVEVQQKYEAEQREKQIELLAKNNEILENANHIQQLQISRSQLQIFLGLSLLLLVLALVALFLRRYLHLLAFWKKKSYIGHFHLEEEISKGGMGIIYRAKNLVKNTGPVALKVLREELALDEKQRQRFIQEGNLIDQLNHPNIVKVYERGETNQRLYIAMEFLDGKPLSVIIQEATQRREAIPFSLCLHLMQQIVSTLSSVHQQAIIHRDITPGNIFVTHSSQDPNFIKLVDFGIAKSYTVTGLTETGEILGTLNYLAPEIIEHREPTTASDIFSLGVVFYELLTLEKPFLSEEPLQVVKQVLEKSPLPPIRYRSDISAELNELVLSMLSKDPHKRPSSSVISESLVTQEIHTQ